MEDDNYLPFVLLSNSFLGMIRGRSRSHDSWCCCVRNSCPLMIIREIIHCFKLFVKEGFLIIFLGSLQSYRGPTQLLFDASFSNYCGSV
jgi:hypothetical protein